MEQKNKTCDICSFLPTVPSDYIILETTNWVVNLGFIDQTFLGRCYIAIKDHVSEIDLISEEVEQEFITVRNRLMKAIRNSFSPITFNVSCLKNDAFKDDPDNTSPEASHVHWHIIPRYGTNPVIINGEAFTDPIPGRYINLDYERKIYSKDTLNEIVRSIKHNMEKTSE